MLANLRAFLIATLLVGSVALLSLFLLRSLFERNLQTEVSPDRRNVALVIEVTGAAATDANLLLVKLHHRFYPFRDNIFGGPNYGGHVSVDWKDSYNLLIRCSECSVNFDPKLVCSWHGIAVHYDFQGRYYPFVQRSCP